MSEHIKRILKDESDYERAFQEELFKNREELNPHSRYSKEKYVNGLVKDGHVERLREKLKTVNTSEAGKMSKNSFRQQLYAIVVGIAFATRAAIEGGLNEEEAYTLSDIYIQEADTCRDSEHLWNLYIKVLLDFAKRVQESKANKSELELIHVAQEYILRHLHFEVTLKEVAEKVNLSENYFSTLYKKETGESISEFIQKNRIKEATSLLRFSDYSIAEIAEYLGFCSQSYFTRIFREYIGYTPGQYRKKHFRSSW